MNLAEYMDTHEGQWMYGIMQYFWKDAIEWDKE